MPVKSCSVCYVYLRVVALANSASQMPGPQQVAEETAAKGALAETTQVVAMVRSLFPTILSAANYTAVNQVCIGRTLTIRRTSHKTVQLHPSHSAILSPRGVP